MTSRNAAVTPAQNPVDSYSRVLLLLDHAAASSCAIERAVSMSTALDAHLHVAITIPIETATAHPMLAVRHTLYLLGKHRVPRGTSFEVARGELASLASTVARDERADLVVVHPRFGAKHACGLADLLRKPVLVARPARKTGEWIAASDMRRLLLPVFSTVRGLAERLDRRVVYFHNATLRRDWTVDAKRARLRDLAMDRDDRYVVTHAGDTVSALLHVARNRDADVIAIGHRWHSWLARFVGTDTTEAIVENSIRSVLVVPVDGVA